MIKSISDIEAACKETSFEEIMMRVEQLIPIAYTTSFCTNFKASGFFRARSHNHVKGHFYENTINAFAQESEFWNVPENSYPIPIGRCNIENESVFYCSTDMATAILEVKPEKGKYISVASFELKNPDIFNGSRVNFIGRGYLSQIPEIASILNYSEASQKQEFKTVDFFLDELFHKNIG